MSTETPDSIPMEAANLMAQLVSANVDSLARTTNRLIDGLTDRAQDAEATIAAIRDGVAALLEKPYAPSASAIEGALWPSDDRIAAWRERCKDLG